VPVEKLPKGIYRRGDILWARFKIKGVEYRESLRTRSVSLAEKRMKAVRQEIENRVFYGAADAVLWQQAVVAWDSWIKRQGKREGTINRYLVSLGQLRPWLDDKDVQRIDHDLVRQIVRDRAKLGVTNATIRRDLTAMSSVLDCAIDEGWITENPAHSYDRRRLKEKRDPVVLPDALSIAAVLEVGSRFVDIAEFAHETGMRQEEIASLTHSQIDRTRMSASLIHTKGRRAREVPLTRKALEIIDRQPPFLRSPYVFWRGEGERFKNVDAQFYATVRRVARKRAQQELPFRVFRFHDLRHLFAVDFLRKQKGSIYELQQILGHVSIKTTEAYLDHLTPDEKQAAIYGVAQNAARNQRLASGEGSENV
jgi:integrase/recombinase XerD